jgi:hypothetical protein
MRAYIIDIRLFLIAALGSALLIPGCFDLSLPPKPRADGGTGKGGTGGASNSVKGDASETGGSGGSGLKTRDPCKSWTDCESKNCVDSVCCESKCDGVCETCNGDLNGDNDITTEEYLLIGKCKPYDMGLDIANECLDLGSCNAACDGEGACRVNQGAGQAESCIDNGEDCSVTRENEQCAGGTCFDGLCGDPCTCTDKNECCNGCYPINEGGSCDDGLYCNGDDTCDGSGNCNHAGDPCDNGDVCRECQEADKTCTYSTNMIWHDSTSELSWEVTPSNSSNVTWQAAVDYCNGLTLCDHDDWRLPTISELRSLIRGCESTQAGGSCRVGDGCLDSSCFDPITSLCRPCPENAGPGNGCYWPAQVNGDCGTNEGSFWSSSSVVDNTSLAWAVGFGYGGLVDGWDVPNGIGVRCVRGGP